MVLELATLDSICWEPPNMEGEIQLPCSPLAPLEQWKRARVGLRIKPSVSGIGTVKLNQSERAGAGAFGVCFVIAFGTSWPTVRFPLLELIQQPCF